MADVVTLGETMALWRADDSGAPVNGARGTLGFGGSDSNVAIALARLGHSSKWISALGDDELGSMIASGIRSEGVETSVKFSNSHFPTDNVLVVGDLNDELTDEESHNVFQTVLGDIFNYKFVDMTLAEA